MKDYNNSNEEILLKSESTNKIQTYLDCLKNSNSLNYLEKTDIINLSKCSKLTNTYINQNYFLLRNLIYLSPSQ